MQTGAKGSTNHRRQERLRKSAILADSAWSSVLWVPGVISTSTLYPRPCGQDTQNQTEAKQTLLCFLWRSWKITQNKNVPGQWQSAFATIHESVSKGESVLKEQLIVRVKFKTCIHTCSNLEFQISQCLTCLTTNTSEMLTSDAVAVTAAAWPGQKTSNLQKSLYNRLYIIGHRSTQFNTVQHGSTGFNTHEWTVSVLSLCKFVACVLWSSVKFCEVLWSSKVEALIVSPIRVATLHVGTVGVKRTSGDVQKMCGCSSCARGRRWKKGNGWKNWKSWSEQVRTSQN